MKTYTKKGDTGKGVFIKQPDIFQLEYKQGGKPHPFLNKFLPASSFPGHPLAAF